MVECFIYAMYLSAVLTVFQFLTAYIALVTITPAMYGQLVPWISFGLMAYMMWCFYDLARININFGVGKAVLTSVLAMVMFYIIFIVVISLAAGLNAADSTT